MQKQSSEYKGIAHPFIIGELGKYVSRFLILFPSLVSAVFTHR